MTAKRSSLSTTPVSGRVTFASGSPTSGSTSCLKPNTAQDGIKKYSDLLSSADLFGRIDAILLIIRGPLKIAREKLLSLQESTEVPALLPETAFVHYKLELVHSIQEISDEETLRARSILESTDNTLQELESLVEFTSQKLLQEIAKKESNTNLIVAQSCLKDCKDILIFFKLNCKILKYFLCTDTNTDLINSEPFAHWKDYDLEKEDILYCISKLMVVNFSS